MSTPSCQISTPNRIVVFEYEVLKVFVCKSDTFFLVHPVRTLYYRTTVDVGVVVNSLNYCDK